MKLKTIEVSGQEYAVLQDGQPVYLHDDNKERPFDAAKTVSTISKLNAESKSHRERAEAAEDKVKAFAGIEDPVKALEALETVGKLDKKKLIDAGEVDRVLADANKAYEARLKAAQDGFAPVVKERDGLKASLISEKIGSRFSNSRFIADKLAIPADLVQSFFGSSFKYEDDAVFAVDREGNKLLSKKTPGQVADFDEALELMIDAYPNRDFILKGANATGSGAAGAGNGKGGKKQLTRQQFDNLGLSERKAHLKSGGSIIDA